MRNPNSKDSVAATRPEGCTNFKLRQLARRVSQLYDAEVGKAGLKTTQLPVTMAADERDRVRQADPRPGTPW